MTATVQARCPAIHCEGCANAIQRSLGKLEGVQSVNVDITGKTVRIQYEDTQTSAAALYARLEAAGFPAD